MKLIRRNEKGSALIFAISMVLILSVIGVSIMFLSNSETLSSTNYRLMTQGRYGAEAGINAAANWFIYSYVPPATNAAAAGPNGYTTTTSPVTDAKGNPIVLSTMQGASNYPDQTQVAGFQQSAAAGTINAGSTPVNYTSSATLLSMQQITPYGQINPVIVQTWQITSDANFAAIRSSAQTEVSAILERQIVPAFSYAAFASGFQCAALQFSGNGSTDSYDSAALTTNGGTINPANLGSKQFPFNTFGGNVGTNGNLTLNGGNPTINGTLSTPVTGFGTCSNGASGNFGNGGGSFSSGGTGFASVGLSANSSSQVTGDSSNVGGNPVQLPQPITFPTPVTDYPGCTGAGAGSCDASMAGSLNGAKSLPSPLTPGNYGDLSGSLALNPGTDANGNCVSAVYYINSIQMSGQSALTINPCPNGKYVPIVINIVGSNQSTPVSITGQGFANPTYDPSMIQMNYAGTGQIKIAGNGANAAVLFAPNATASFKGNGTFYGSVIAAQVTDVGNGAIHFDLNLKKKLWMVGNQTLDSFTWSKF